VKQSGGSIHVYSEPGQGTTFKVYFPEVNPAAFPGHADDKTMAVARDLPSGETVLIVEDEEGVRKLVERSLSEWGYRFLSAADAESALEIARTYPEPIHLLLTDVILPGMNGKALADRLALSRPGIKVLFMSGYTDNAIVHHGVLDDGTEFLNKPFSTQALKHRLLEVLGRAEQKD